jgi:uncharacterized delta-60 repeat protein
MTLIKQTNTIFSKLFLTIFVSLSIFNAIFAADGDLDLSFNGTGKVITQIGDNRDASWASAVQVDGKIVTVGTSGNDQSTWSGKGFAIARYNVDGSLDKSFDFDGKLFIAKRYSGKADSIAIQRDGKILFGGEYSALVGSNQESRYALIRLNSNGSLDNTFGDNGFVRLPNQLEFFKTSIAIQENGKIMVGGSSYQFQNGNAFFDASLIQLNPDGGLDLTFGVGGIAIWTLPYASGSINSIAIQQDNKTVVSTYRGLFRFNEDGTIDSSFGLNGSILTSSNFYFDLKIQTDGKIVVVGSTAIVAGVYRKAIFRYNANGSPDSTFDGDGVAEIEFVNGFIESLEIQSDGKIIVAAATNRLSLLRFNPDGSLDEKFGEYGVYKHWSILPNVDVYQVSIVLQSDDKIISTMLQGNTPGGDFEIVRHNSDGSLDTTFGSGGLATTGDFAGKSGLNSMAIQGDGKIVAVGGYGGLYSNIFSRFDIARHNTDGTLDVSFGSNGKVSTELGRFTNSLGSFGSAQAKSVAIQTDGKIVVSGECDTLIDAGWRRILALVRYNPNGSIDSSFGGSGKILLPIPGSEYANLYTSLIQVDGKIVVAGTSSGVGTMVRFNSDGRLDASFGTNGILLDSTFGSNSLAIQPDGKFVAAEVGLQSFAFRVVRYKSDGSKDASFGVGGIATSSCKVVCFLKDVKVQSDGKIVGAGRIGDDFVVTRFNSNGTLDTTFNGTGKITGSFEGVSEAQKLAIQNDGKIIVSGYSDFGGFRTARYNSDGSLDITFGSNGKITTQFEGLSSHSSSVLIQPNGKILVGGTSGLTFGLARYEGTLVAESSTIGGRISTASGRAIRNVTLQISGGNLTQPKIARTNSFGYYRFQDLEVGQTYLVSVSAKRYTFANPSRVITLNENLDGEDFVSEGK